MQGEKNMVPSRILGDAISYAYKQGDMQLISSCLRTREQEFASELAMNLTGIAFDVGARMAFQERLKANMMSRANILRTTRVGELIIGSGFHAATYAAARVLSGFRRPLVVERSAYAGGTFAVSPRAVFYLNSRNRPGPLGFPGEEQALNYLPGAPIQPSDLGMAEYQTNAEMAFVIQVTLAQYANVLPNISVESVEPATDNEGNIYSRVVTSDGDLFLASRVIDARGLGDPVAVVNGTTIMNFTQFMQLMATPFPLRNRRRVAVVGDGDSARCVVESLLGLAPQPMMTMASDYVEKIGWYGERLANKCESWERQERSRYIRIGKYLRGTENSPARLRVFRERGQVLSVLNRAVVNERGYDLVVMATGNGLPNLGDQAILDVLYTRNLATSRGNAPSYYRVGPIANLPFSEEEENARIADIPANRVAMFRLANRTAVLASTLPNVEAPVVV
jgi:hypothetical protein